VSSSASLVEFEIIAHETSLNLARRAAFAAERAIAEERAQFDQRTALPPTRQTPLTRVSI